MTHIPQIPFLIMADSIAGSTGLARIARDIALRIHSDPDLSPLLRVGSFGIGGPIASSSRFPFFNCSVLRLQQMIPLDLPDVWNDFARGEKGILFTIQNASWVQYLSQPYLLPPDFPLRQFLLQRPQSVSPEHWASISNPAASTFSPALLSRLADTPFQRWLYCPIDGHLPDGTLGHQLAPILTGFDRLLAYTRYGAEVIERTLEKWAGRSPVTTINSVPNLPHGADSSIFLPRDRALARQTFLSRISNGATTLPLRDDQLLLCCIATNTSRKDWGLVFQTCAELLRRGLNVFLWGHTDLIQPNPASPSTHWNLPALAKQFGLTAANGQSTRIVITSERLSDEDLSWAYSAVDCMLAPHSEGWGLPAAECLASGCPVVGTTYAGSAEFTPPRLQVAPSSYYLENPFLIQRPLHSPVTIANKVEEAVGAGLERIASLLPPEYEWKNLWPRWREWLLKGVRQ